MTYKLFGRSGTGSDAPRMILEEGQIPYEFVSVSKEFQYSTEFGEINALSQIPVLQAPDGAILTESGAISLHLAESFPSSTSLLPPERLVRAEIYRWLFFAGTNLYEDYRRYYHADSYIAAESENALRVGALKLLEKHWSMVDQALMGKKWMTGDTLTVADIYLAMLSDWSPDRQNLWDRFGEVSRMCQQLGSRPAAVKVGLAQLT